MKEKLQEYALLAEIVSALVIVVSLFFVGFQIQQSNSIAKADSYHNLMVAFNENSVLARDYESAAQAILEFQNGNRDTADPDVRARVTANLQTQFRVFDSAYYYYKYGILGEEEWRRMTTMICFIVNESPPEQINSATLVVSGEFRSFLREQQC